MTAIQSAGVNDFSVSHDRIKNETSVRCYGGSVTLTPTNPLLPPFTLSLQATLAPLVVAAGVENGEIILAIAVMSILAMAPLSTLLIEVTCRSLLHKTEPSGLGEAVVNIPG